MWSCIKVDNGSWVNSQTARRPCSDKSAIYIVTETGDSTTACDVNEAFDLQGTDADHPTSKVCLRYNPTTGACLDMMKIAMVERHKGARWSGRRRRRR